jgi:hypothetical protein
MPYRAHFACLLGAMFAMLVGVSAYQLGHAKSKLSPRLAAIDDCYSDEERRQEELYRFDGVFMARSAQRKAIVEQVRDGNLTLFEAAAQFKRLNHQPQPTKLDPLYPFAGQTENEKVCRQVITWLTSYVQDLPPSQGEAVLERAEAELRDHLACNGTVILPGDGD